MRSTLCIFVLSVLVCCCAAKYTANEKSHEPLPESSKDVFWPSQNVHADAAEVPSTPVGQDIEDVYSMDDESDCLTQEETCFSNYECCSGRCDMDDGETEGHCKLHDGSHQLGSTIKDTYSYESECLEPEETCLYNYQCCSGRCDVDDGETEGHCKLHDGSHQLGSTIKDTYSYESECLEPEETCMYNSQCCSDRCDVDDGETEGHCKLHDGSHQMGDDDLGGTENYSSSYSYESEAECLAQEMPCTENEQCCSGRCDTQNKVDEGWCKLHDGSHEEEVETVTTTSQKKFWGSDQKLRGASKGEVDALKCLEQEEECTMNADCCSGMCDIDDGETKGQCKLHDGSHQ